MLTPVVSLWDKESLTKLQIKDTKFRTGEIRLFDHVQARYWFGVKCQNVVKKMKVSIILHVNVNGMDRETFQARILRGHSKNNQI